MLPPIKVRWPEPVSDEAYNDAVEGWNELEASHPQEVYYREKLFPLSCERVRAVAPDEKVELLFVPVGTQAYPPIIACIGTPAKRVVLLHTQRTLAYAEEVVAAVTEEIESAFHLVLIDERDPLDIPQKIQSCYDAFGQPPNHEVVCDQTGGTKVITATISGFAAMNGWRQVYVQSQFMPGRVGSYNEEVLAMPNLFQALGGFQKEVGWRLAGVGQFEAAERSLRQALDDSIASGPDQSALRMFRLAAAYRRANLAAVCKAAPKFARDRAHGLPESTLALLKERTMPQGFYYWVAVTLSKERQSLAACAVLALAGVNTEAANLKTKLTSLRNQYGREWRLKDWKALDQLLGANLSKEAATRAQG